MKLNLLNRLNLIKPIARMCNVRFSTATNKTKLMLGWKSRAFAFGVIGAYFIANGIMHTSKMEEEKNTKEENELEKLEHNSIDVSNMTIIVNGKEITDPNEKRKIANATASLLKCVFTFLSCIFNINNSKEREK